MDGQDRALPGSVATACSNYPALFQSTAGQQAHKFHVKRCTARTGQILQAEGHPARWADTNEFGPRWFLADGVETAGQVSPSLG
jgi:hypothetical protein